MDYNIIALHTAVLTNLHSRNRLNVLNRNLDP